MGIVRHADAGYETSSFIAKNEFQARGGKVPMCT
jgi:hypothetical protein